MPELIALIAVVILALVVVGRAVRVIQQSTVGVVQRMGRYQRTIGPGVHLLVPMLDRVAKTVDMKETVQAFPPQPVITQDNVTIGVDTVVYYQVTDAVKATYEVANMLQAMEQLTVTTLRNVVGSMTLEETLTSRDQINSQLRFVLDEATEKWGVRVTRVELKSIDPPRTIQEAMEQQMRADRAKRATVLEAEGEKQARALRADGEAQALARVFDTVRASGIAPADMLGYKYIEALPAVAAGEANKLLLLPTGAADAMGAVAGLGAAFSEGAAPTREKDTPGGVVAPGHQKGSDPFWCG
jgi:regulator of protease activity HflC (stomatin/prohibitin superfamily)